jgi:isopentenyldiphosphate isomerase
MSDDGGELFPLVTEAGERIGVATRAQCHADPALLHPSIHVVVVAADGLVWQLRGPRKDSAPLHWDHACSGHVGVDEDDAGAALRELAEELGVSARAADLVLLGRRVCELGGESELTSVYRLRHDGPLRFAPPELSGLVVLPTRIRPAPLSPSCALLNGWLDETAPGWDSAG